MGNCIQSVTTPWQLQQQHQQQENKEEVDEVDHEGKGSVKVKVVLTRKELEWLMFKLKEHKEKRLEDVLMEMNSELSKGRKDCGGWKPSLESIMECPEIQTLDMNH